MTVISSRAGPSTRFPAKSVVETSSCMEKKMKEFISALKKVSMGVILINRNHKMIGE